MFTKVIDRNADRRRLVGAAHMAALAAALLLIASPANAEPQPFRSPSKSIETTSDMVNLPAPGGTAVIARGCDSCDPVSLSLGAATEFRIGRRSVSFVEFRDKARSGVYDTTVHYHRTTLEVLKIRLASRD